MVFGRTSSPCSGADSLLDGQSLVSNQTLVSKGRKFSLGFFSPGNSTNRYLGIWYTNIPVLTVVWVANRNNPVRNAFSNSSRLQLAGGHLNYYDGSQVIWAVNVSNATDAVLFDSGNLALSDASGVIWQSFDNPTDTWLPAGKVGYSRISNEETRLISWKSPSDPAPGVFSLGVDPKGRSAEIFMWRYSSQIWRSGVWQDGKFPSIFSRSGQFNFTYVSGDDAVYFMYNVLNDSIISRIELGYEGVLRLWIWIADSELWTLFVSSPADFCEQYNICGANAICNIMSAPACTCLVGFIPKSPEAWAIGDFSGGCVRRNRIPCSGRDEGYLKVSGIRLPANPSSLAVGIGIYICQIACSVNCSCNAYAYSSKEGCLMYADLVDLQLLSNTSLGSDFYVKMNITSVDSTGKGNKNLLPLAIALPTVAAMIICCSCSCYLWRKPKRKQKKGSKLDRSHQNLLLLDLSTNSPLDKSHRTARTGHEEEEKNKYELPISSLSSIVEATNNFSVSNKLGEGGFGPVYKGELLNRQFVAVKRLSRRSGQGLEEFRNETELFAKLQHRNLVGILGCCVEEDEKILVYEYMPNKSLDLFLFGQNEHQPLDWGTRVKIIEGIVQGLLYLHQYSRFRTGVRGFLEVVILLVAIDYFKKKLKCRNACIVDWLKRIIIIVECMVG